MDNKEQKKRQFGLSSLAVDNATSIIILGIMILIFGIQSYNRMPKEQYPEASLPTVYINTPYFGNSAKEIENLIAKPIEKEIASISGIKNVVSTSMQDYSAITAEFDADLDIDDVIRKVKDAVDLAKSELPNDLDEDPRVLEVKFSDLPIMTVNISGRYSMDAMRKFAEYLEDQIESVATISSVDIKGAREREVKIDMDLAKMQALQVAYGDVQNAIQGENLNMSGGEIIRNDFRRAIRVIGQFETVEEIGNVIVKSENQKPIYLKDIADVKYDWEEETSIARMDGLPVVSLDVIKRSGENLLFAADEVKNVVDEAREVLPEDLKISLFNDLSVYTRNEVSNLENSIISGVLLVVLVLLFFLGTRNALFVGIAIPLSMLMGIMWLFISGTTMNIVVLFSLILALGLLVDNAIVVVENIYRYMQQGAEGKEASKYGAGEVALPIIASTATTLAAFVPLAFWPGIMGEFMKYLPITLIIVLSSSLFVALVINPVLTSRFMRVDTKDDDADEYKRKRNNILRGALIMLFVGTAFHFAGIPALRNLMGFATLLSLINFFVFRPASFGFQNSVLPVLERGYNKFIGGALKIPYGVFAGTFLLMFLAIAALVIKAPKVEFFPASDPLYVNVFLELPIGKDIEATNAIVKDIEDKVTKIIEPNKHIVEALLVQIGENTSDPNSPPEPGVTPHKARITIQFLEYKERGEISTWDIMDDIRAELQDVAGVKIIIDKNADGPPAGKPINIELQGDDMEDLAILSEEVIQYLEAENVPGVEELQADVKIGKPELLINVDRAAARRYELSTFAIANAIRTSVFGTEVSKFKQGDDEYPIQLRLGEAYRNNVDALLAQKITFRNATSGQIVQVPISAVASVDYTSTYTAVKRKDEQRMITIYSNIIAGYNANEVVSDLKGVMAGYDMPIGYTYDFTGEQEQQAEDMSFLTNAFIIIIFSIFIILVAQFNSIISPFIIILSILFSTIGVFLGYAFTGRTISVIFTGVGIISLAGVVVNNAIVLIDYINLLIKNKREEKGVESMMGLTKDEVRDAIIQGGATRLRPVLLTAITTVLGLVPLAIGFNFNFFTFISRFDPQIFIGGDNTAIWGPMAWTVIYGLVFATFLTLVVVPVMYWLAYKLKRATSGLGRRSKNIKSKPAYT